MRQAGRYLPEYVRTRGLAGDFLDLCYNPDLATEVTLQPINRYGFDAAIIFSDILVIPDALGQKVEFSRGVGPVLKPIRTEKQIIELNYCNLGETLSPVYEAIAQVRARLSPDVSLIGFAGAPWTVATYMVEGGSSKSFNNVKAWAMDDSGGFDELMKHLIEAITLHIMGQVEAGAEVIQLFDSWAGVLSPSEFERWCIKPVREITKRIKDKYTDIPIIGFPKGSGLNYKHYPEKTGVDCVSVDYTVPLDWIDKALQPGTVVQGNLDPHILRRGGAAMVRAVQEIKDAMGHRPFVFNLGHGILPDTDPSNVGDLVELVRAA
tara:strand:+ start:13714 stop:14676 length:963 start_codon:yes stop_codon:yes gene_type:complete